MMNWLERNLKAIQAASAIATALIALAALVAVKVQIDASAQLQREQSARDIYREFLTLSIAQPKFAQPKVCALAETPEDAGYDHYLTYLLYASEQVLAVQPDWEPVMAGHLTPHREALCKSRDWLQEAPRVQSLIARFKADQCKGFVSNCPAEQDER
jgi:hypothetical protein